MRFRQVVPLLAAALALPALALAAPAAMHPEVAAKLTGKAEVPKGSPTGRGIVNVTLDAAKGKVCWTFEGIGGTDGPQAAHIHKAPVGKAGPVVVPFGKTYRAKGCTTAARKTIEAVEAHPNSYYVNVHTAKYSAGAIRGQLVSGMLHM